MEKKNLKKVLLITGAVFFLLVIFYFSLRGYFLNKALERVQHKFSTYGLNLKVSNIEFDGLTAVNIEDLTIYPDKGDTLLLADSIFVSLRLFPLFSKKIRIKDLAVYNADLYLIQTDSADNFSHILNSDEKVIEEVEQRVDSIAQKAKALQFGELANEMVEKFFKNTPDGTRIKNATAQLITENNNLKAWVEDFNFADNYYTARVDIVENNLKSLYRSQGEINPRERKFDFVFYSADANKIYLPFLNPRLSILAGFDSVRLNLRGKAFNNGILNLYGKVNISEFVLNNERIAPTDVKVNYAAIEFDLNIGPDYAELDNGSSVTINQIVLNPYIKYERAESELLTLNINQSTFSAQDFFNSLPQGLFTTLHGIKADGYLSYAMNFHVDFSNPDALTFNSDMDGKDFKIKEYGDINFQKLNVPFLHKVYVDGRFIKSFVVGPRNPDFTPLEHISPYLIYAVINNEDGTFYSHEGFNEYAFKESIALNIKRKAFVRGASTIPMQLVKNVFLSRDKTITRKLEEIIIVWLIENQDLVSKRRMLEVYFNIIEFGPNIYGVSNGTSFYFNKAPSELTLAEALFMSSIVPRPRLFRYSFDESGRLLSHYENYYDKLSRIMVSKGQIEPEERANLVDSIYLAGPASKYFENYDQHIADSLIITLDPIFN